MLDDLLDLALDIVGDIVEAALNGKAKDRGAAPPRRPRRKPPGRGGKSGSEPWERREEKPPWER